MSRALNWSDLELLDLLGTGRSAAVFHARLRQACGDLPAGYEVAVKRYKDWILDEPGFVERLFREVDTGRKIVHSNLLRVYGAILDSQRRPALVMDLCHGITLDQQLKAHRKQGTRHTFESANELLEGIARGLAALHANGVLHRDIKPANILLHGDRAVIADFGVVRSSTFPEQTTTGAFLGTIRYAAPEYLFGDNCNVMTDVYSFGCIAYEVYSGKEAFGDLNHWAELVYAKGLRKGPFFHPFELQLLAKEIGIRAAEFVGFTVDSMVLERQLRQLSLEGFADAVRGQSWRSSFVAENGRLTVGTPAFKDRFGTAPAALWLLRDELTAEEWPQLRSFLRLHYWLGAIRYSEDPFLQRLWRLGVLEMSDEERWAYFRIAGSIREAFSLGHLDA